MVSEDTTFVRRKFTITKSLDETLESLANQHYQNNVSQCLRAAIEDHRSTLNGIDETMLMHQIIKGVQNLQHQQDGVFESIKSINQSIDQIETHEPDLQLGPPDQSIVGRQILSILKPDSALRLDDITEELDLMSHEIQPVLGRLTDRALIETTDSHPVRFRLAGYSGQRGGEQNGPI